MNNRNFGNNNQNNNLFKIPINYFQPNILDIITKLVTNIIIGFIKNSNNQKQSNFIINNNNTKEISLGQKNYKDKTINSNESCNISLKKRK